MTRIEIARDVPLAPWTTLGLGGPARHFVRATDEDTLLEALRWAEDHGVAVAILGGGSNLLVPDHGYAGLVIRMEIGGIELGTGGELHAGAGVPWEAVVDAAVARDWAGLECLTGIPGSTGATPIQNVGAYGQEVADVLEEVRVLDRRTLSFHAFSRSDCELAYRNSRFKREPDRFVVCAVRFRLRPHGPGTIRYAELERAVGTRASLSEIRGTVLELRRRKSMVLDPHDPNRRSAGSFFLNPIVSLADAERIAEMAVRRGWVQDATQVPRFPAGPGRAKLAAGWLIEQSGFPKGTRRGAVGLSSKHALCLVHHGGGTTAELLCFADEIRARVQERFGVLLEQEPRVLGE